MRMLWFTIRDAGSRRWRVYLVSECLDPDDHGARRALLGITHFDRREIEVSIKQSWREAQNTVVHEVMHAAAGVKRDKPWSRELEEAFITKSERSMRTMIEQLGFRVPPLPDGVMMQPPKREQKTKKGPAA